jgi:hypothetical protein
MFFRNICGTDGFNIDFHFSRRAKPKSIAEQNLVPEDFHIQEVEEFFRPCAVDPGVATLVTASYGIDGERRRFTNNEYYAVTGSGRRNHDLNKLKRRSGIQVIESQFPTAKTIRETQYHDYVRHFFMNKDALFNFYGEEGGERRFYDYQGRQRAIEESANILINGGKKYNRRKRKKTKKNLETRNLNRMRKANKNRRQNMLEPRAPRR